jgi:NADPH:quinone reductase-like Zn-dependent oxidoreductase
MRAWQIASSRGIEGLELVERETPSPGPGQVRVRVRASSLNNRDLQNIRDPVARRIVLPRIPNSDAAGDVVAVGPGVTSLRVGDRVASCFFQSWEEGTCSQAAMDSALGGAMEGVLAEEVVLQETGVVPIPDYLTYEEASTLPCAAVTSWNAVMEIGRVQAGHVVLLLGTGGVSVFSLQFAQSVGARVIITSSSEERLARARALGAAVTINYRTVTDWERAVLEATDGRGVDLVVEVGGGGTLPRSLAAARIAGTVALIGVLTGGQIDPSAVMRKSIRLQGLYVGSRRMFMEMIRAMETQQMRPVIERTYPFEEARSAFRALGEAQHFGKIVVNTDR